ncbi:hypothetical protein EZJ19_10120 [Parasulfuritortus cantonensis]|uniref:Uncharacterized protein n=1 Tax=Parasulfuritortus cantonensis TaxID=2528202 RepID=A0A4R1B9C6_9PROT|nr:hypothetical protein [Parasulfuritortus cantonensis]TCJ13504.1 hypothetical protein EZJ19_10120 [Parasulfuritortus cantonensis]
MAGAASRHDFVIVVPVADRPRHLADCLASLAGLLQHHPYAGAVQVLAVDDSLAADNQARHRAIAAEFSAAGLPVHYLDQAAQGDLVAALPASLRGRLAGPLGDGGRRGHKGASVTRNIAYLWLNRLPDTGRPQLFWFVDSDQEFRVNLARGEDEELAYAVDYLGELDRLFSTTGTQVLTGKVVGDPPVSPAVMAGNFVADVTAFLTDLAGLDGDAECRFHGRPARQADDAAYHDMADLFGFRAAAEAWRYPCPLRGRHDHAACLADFAARLGHFFDGEHPTRRSHYRPDAGPAGLKPARTVYTGNYVFSRAGLAWFIPFADLRLRMAGPTLGRIMRAELGDAFASANLPMLHRRTVADSGRAECRPGVVHGGQAVDLSGEFERQYFGDVMLFSMETLCAAGYPGAEPTAVAIAATVAATEAAMRGRYRERQASIAAQVEDLAALFEAPERWWHGTPGLAAARAGVGEFIANLRANFGTGAPAWHRIEDAGVRQAQLDAIAAAIGRYGADRAAWQAALAAGAA